MIVIMDGLEAWACGEEPFRKLRDGTLVIAVDPTRGAGSSEGPIQCHMAGRVWGGVIEKWSQI